MILAAAALAALITPPAWAERSLGPPWELWGAPLTPEPIGDPGRREADDTALHIDAGHARYEGQSGDYTLRGRPIVTRADQRVEAERLDYDAETGVHDAEGPLRYDEAGAVLEGGDGEFNLDRSTGTLASARYRIEAGHLQGEAGRAEMLGPGRSRYHDATLSTCNPGEEVWRLRADRLTIDQSTRQGIARNAWLDVGPVPVFYTPYLRFPVGSDRLTGFLAPSAGRSNTGGAELSLPFYWNIAPNFDSTLTPTIYTERGLRLDTELRYLQPWIAGEIELGVLPDDQVFGDDRWSIDQEHELAIGEHLRGELVQRRVSDTDWPSDFGDNLDVSAESHLQSRAALAWSQRDWSAAVDAQSWQTIDPGIAPRNRPYAREPRVQLRLEPFDTGLPVRYAINAEAVDFTHPAPDLRTTGRRLDLLSRVSLPVRSLGWYVEPAASWRQTAYDLDRPDPGAPAEPDRGLPIYSLDAGLFFERDTRIGERELIQTLEPRLFYLNVPQRDQDDLPRFDTGLAGFNFPRLFSENRFTGPDRVGDANQLSLGVTSRLVDPFDGREYLRASLGQIFHFEDREVTLSGDPETASRSDYVAEVQLNPTPALSLRLDAQLDPEDSDNRALRSLLQWRSDARTVINVDYRTRQLNGARTQEQANVTLALPIGRHWRVFGGWRYDLLDDRTQERFAGLGYESCCYAVRAVQRSYLRPQSDGPAALESQFLIEFELKGLGGIGDRISSFIEDSVRGYRALP